MHTDGGHSWPVNTPDIPHPWHNQVTRPELWSLTLMASPSHITTREDRGIALLSARLDRGRKDAIPTTYQRTTNGADALPSTHSSDIGLFDSDRLISCFLEGYRVQKPAATMPWQA